MLLIQVYEYISRTLKCNLFLSETKKKTIFLLNQLVLLENIKMLVKIKPLLTKRKIQTSIINF